MSIISINPAVDFYSKEFGRLALPAWIMTGVVGFALFVTAAWVVVPDLLHFPHNGIDVFLILLLLVCFILGGPAALPAGPLMFGLLLLCGWLSSIQF